MTSSLTVQDLLQPPTLFAVRRISRHGHSILRDGQHQRLLPRCRKLVKPLAIRITVFYEVDDVSLQDTRH